MIELQSSVLFFNVNGDLLTVFCRRHNQTKSNFTHIGVNIFPVELHTFADEDFLVFGSCDEIAGGIAACYQYFWTKIKVVKNYFPIPRVWVKNLVLDLPNKLANKRHTALDVAKTIEHILKRTTPLRKIDCINFTITQRSFWFSPISQLWQEKLWMVRKIQIENEWLSRSMKRQVSKHTTVFSSNKKHIRILSGYVCLSNKWIRGCLFIAWVTWQEIVRQR